MVKVLLLQLFESQRVVAIDEEPLEIVSTGNAFLAATRSGSVHHYSAGVECILLHQFSTFNPTILALQYAPSTDCVVTLEKEAPQSAINVARVYYNWRISPPEEELPASPSSLDLTPIIEHRIPTSSSHSVGVFKLPIPSSITCITVCPSTGRIAAATKSSVSIWVLQHLHGDTNNNNNNNNETKDKFHMEKILELDAPNVTRLALYEHYLGYTCCDDLEVKVLYLNITFDDPNSQPPTPSASSALSSLYEAASGNGGTDSSSSSSTNLPTSNSTGNLSSILKSSRDSIGSDSGFTNGVDSAPTTITIPDEHFIELSFDAAGNPTHKFQLASITPSPAPPSTPSSSGHRHSISSTPSSSSASGLSGASGGAGDSKDLGNDLFESLGPFTDSDHHANVNAEAGYSLASSLLLLHRRFSADDPIHTLSFLPEYEQQTEQTEEGQVPAHDANSASFGAYSNYLPPIIAMRMLVSTARQGYIYKLSNPALLATYTYTAESLQCCASPCFLYVLTSVGLETWTLRTSDTYLPKSDPGVTTKLRIPQTAETYDVFPPPCLIGLQPFISLQRIVVVGDAILLLSKINTPPSGGPGNKTLAAPIPQQGKRKGAAPIASSPSAQSPGGGTYTAASTSVHGPKRAEAWSLYVLHLTSLSLLYNEIISTAASYDDSNPNVYYQLVLEGHFLLKSKLSLPKPFYGTVGVGLAGLPSQVEPGLLKGGLIVDAAVALNMNIEAQNNRALLRRSSTLLANFYVKQKEYMLAAMQYATSDRPIGEVVKLLNAQELTFYLDRVLFDPNMVHLLDEDVALADTILMHYHKHAPARLPSVILDSSLSSYTQSLALQLLEMRDGKDAKDLFARALLYLDQGRVSDAMTVFKSIDSYALVQFCISNPKLLAPIETTEPEQEGVPLLGKILRITSPWELLSIIVGLSSYIPVSVAVAMLRGSTADSDTMYYHPDLDLDNLLLKCFYEHLVVEAIKGKNLNLKDYGEIIVNLATIYLDDIARHRGVDEPIFRAYPKKESERDNSEKVVPSPGRATAVVDEGEDHAVLWRRFHLKTFLHRPISAQWLDQLPPFDAHAKKGAYDRPSTRNPYELDDDADFDYTYLYVKKCQALLIAANQLQPYIDQTGPAPLERFVQALASPTPLSPSQSPAPSSTPSPIAHPLTFSLQLLALPMANRLRAGLQQVVMYFPQVAFDYGRLFCRQPSQWADLLDELLRASLASPISPSTPSTPNPPSTNLISSSSPSSPSPSPASGGQSSGNASVAANVYSQIVEYLTAHVDPEAFLNLLPSKGHLKYFLPYIEKAFCRHRAKSLKSNISQFVALDLEGHVHATS